MYIVNTNNLVEFFNEELMKFELCKKNKWVVILVLEIDEYIYDDVKNDKKECMRHLINLRLNCIEKDFYRCYEISAGNYVFLSSVKKQHDIHLLSSRLTSCFLISEDDKANSVLLTPTVGVVNCSGKTNDASVWLEQAREDVLKSREERERYNKRASFNSIGLEYKPADKTELILKEELLSGLEAGQMNVVFQPLWNYDKSKIYGAEALLRWQHPDKGDVSPDLFIPLAEQSIEIISTLEKWVIDKVLQKIKQWKDDYRVTIKVFANISAVNMKNNNIAQYIIDKLLSYGISSENFGVEITESALLENNLHIINQLNNLKRNGITLTLDDFGTGYSSFSYLAQFPFDNIKIPQEFIRNIVTQKKLSVIVKSLINLSKSLNIGTIAEGIETKEQESYLDQLGCENGQGYLFGRPMHEDKFLNHVKKINM